MLVLTVPGLLPPLQLMRKIASATIASSNPITCAQTHYSVLLNFGLDDSNVPCSNLIAQVTFVHQEGHSVRTVHQTYAEYPLIIFSKDGKKEKEIARVTADGNGNYRVALPPGAYILDVQDRGRKHIRGKPQRFTVVSNQTVRVDMDVDTGIR
jgi:hypothetical protein